MLESNDTSVPGIGSSEKNGQTTEEQTGPPGVRIPHRLSLLPGELTAQLEAYRLLKASRWRAERVAANSTGFYSLHGRLWEFFCGEYGLQTVSELQLEHVQQFIKARLEAGRSARTVNVSLSCLRSFLAFVQEDQVAIHPSLDKIQRLKEGERLPRYISSGQVLRLQSEVEAQVSRAPTQVLRSDALLLRAVFYLLWQGGLRSGEVELLRF